MSRPVCLSVTVSIIKKTLLFHSSVPGKDFLEFAWDYKTQFVPDMQFNEPMVY